MTTRDRRAGTHKDTRNPELHGFFTNAFIQRPADATTGFTTPGTNIIEIAKVQVGRMQQHRETAHRCITVFSHEQNRRKRYFIGLASCDGSLAMSFSLNALNCTRSIACTCEGTDDWSAW